jgi:hypothetical protein
MPCAAELWCGCTNCATGRTRTGWLDDIGHVQPAREATDRHLRRAGSHWWLNEGQASPAAELAHHRSYQLDSKEKRFVGDGPADFELQRIGITHGAADTLRR